MSKNNYFTIKSTIEYNFETSQIRDFSFNSFLPEFKKLKTKRSEISMEKKDNVSIVFEIRSIDITAFRASINEITSFGKIITESLKIVDNSKNK
jgi:tRNA threonylcarbamoyladenosine modification (KEOPS) complex  Pcc1 subunit